MKMYFKYLSIQMKSAFEYRGSMVFSMISSALTTVATFFGILCLFERFNTIGGYTINQVLITYSIVTFSFAFSECFFRGFDQFDKLVRNGELDRLLIRPRSIFLQVLGFKTEWNKLGRMVFSGGIIIYALIAANIEWTLLKAVVIALMIVGTVVMFAGIFLIFSSVSIFTVEGVEAVNIITNGGRDLCYYPLDIYANFFKKFFTFMIPFACINYLPLRFVLGFENTGIFHALSPLLSIVFFGICYLIFQWSLTKYKSTGN